MNYFLKLSKTGAIRKTPKRIIKKIVSELELKDNCCVLELGGGKGEITNEIVAKYALCKNFSITIIENERTFYENLYKLFPTYTVKFEDAFFYENYLPKDKKFDYIISSIPLSFHSPKDIIALFKNLDISLFDNGKLIVLFHAHWLIKTLKSVFQFMQLHKYFTIPPYYLVVYTKKQNL